MIVVPRFGCSIEQRHDDGERHEHRPDHEPRLPVAPAGKQVVQ